MSDEQLAVDPRLRVDDFAYELPTELIAQTPLPNRDGARLLVLDRASGEVHHSTVQELVDWLSPGDLLVANNSRVLAARLRGARADTGGRVELLLLRRESTALWSALAKPARRLRPGIRIEISPCDGSSAGVASATIVEPRANGEVLVELNGDLESSLDRYGRLPLPPYIRQELAESERYQTVYASAAGSAAAPTAGLHFTDGLIRRLGEAGIGWAEVTLHVGLDTFRPVTVDRVADHAIHQEWFSVSDADAVRIARAKREQRRIVAIGTTAARTLETLAQHWRGDEPRGVSGLTNIFITPGYRWQMVDAMLTNFHLPRSTLLMMVSAFAEPSQIQRAYATAIAERYRFFSFGDAMLIR